MPSSHTLIHRLIHIENLSVLLQRRGLHAPTATPADGLPYRTIHNREIQDRRRVSFVPCGPDGVIHDYVSFYFCTRSPMLYQLHTGRVAGYNEGQSPLVYLVSSAQKVQASGASFVFSDGHGIAAFTSWYDDLKDLDKVDWAAVQATMWRDTEDDMDRQRRKQAEFLVHHFCSWDLIIGIAVLDAKVKTQVEAILAQHPADLARRVEVRRHWYY